MADNSLQVLMNTTESKEGSFEFYGSLAKLIKVNTLILLELGSLLDGCLTRNRPPWKLKNPLRLEWWRSLRIPRPGLEGQSCRTCTRSELIKKNISLYWYWLTSKNISEFRYPGFLLIIYWIAFSGQHEIFWVVISPANCTVIPFLSHADLNWKFDF